MTKKPFIIALEEHYADAEVQATFTGMDANKIPRIGQRLDDVGALRIKEMDDAGIDVQVLGHTAPAVHKLDPETSVRIAKAANDRLYETCRAHPGRFEGFAILPTPDPKAAADELERCVTKLNFKGAMVHGLTDGKFLDDKMFWPIFERASQLDVPIYMHPAIPQPAVIEAYYKEYIKDWPMFLRAGWGFTVEAATQGVRMVLSGVFDKYPNSKIILGHLGEGIPFLLWRINHSLARETASKSFRDYFCQHFYITTSGFFSNPALLLCMQEMGIDRIMFSVDYPFVDNTQATKWALEEAHLSPEDRVKLLSGNAKRLLKIGN